MNNDKSITIRVPKKLYARIRRLPRDISYTDAVREFLTDFVSEILDQEKSVENSTVNDPVGSDRAPMTDTDSITTSGSPVRATDRSAIQ